MAGHVSGLSIALTQGPRRPGQYANRGGDVAQKGTPNWKKIKAEYVRGGISQRQLAQKYGVSFSTIERRARLEKWTDLRKEREGKATEKLIQKTADIQADTAARLYEMQSRAALALYEKMLLNIERYPNGAGTKTTRETVTVKKINLNGEDRDFPLHTVFTNDLESTVRSMATLAKLFGIDVASEQARERLNLQKQQNGGDEDIDAFNDRMVSLAELIRHPLPDRTMEDVEAAASDNQPAGDSNG